MSAIDPLAQQLVDMEHDVDLEEREHEQQQDDRRREMAEERE
jgi:hypothetical protein